MGRVVNPSGVSEVDPAWRDFRGWRLQRHRNHHRSGYIKD